MRSRRGCWPVVAINVWGLLAVMGLPTAVTAFCFWLVERRISRRDKKRDAAEAKRLERAREDAAAREDLQVITLQGVSAAIALGEATARAVQRIPDAHCNGDMHAALDYAAEIKHRQKDFLARQGVHGINDNL